MHKNKSSKKIVPSTNAEPANTAVPRLNQQEKETLTAESPRGKGVLATVPSLNNASVIQAFQANIMGKDADLGAMINMLDVSIKTVAKDDLTGLEEMLLGQATALQTIFTSMARRAAVQQQLPQYQTYLGLALKAQAQSRATITALVDLKHPRQAAFFGQANLTTGPQQVNNVIHAAPENGTPQNPPNQLSGGAYELHQDTRAQSLESGLNTSLEALGGVNRAKIPRG